MTIPSLMAQGDREFVWLVHVDGKYAEQERQILGRAIEGALTFEVVPVSGRLTPQSIEGPIPGNANPGDLIATARLDSDDAYGPDYVSRMKSELMGAPPPISVDFPDGVMVDIDRGIPLYRPYFSSAFQTLLAEVTPEPRITTGLHLDHSRVAESVPYRAVRTDSPQWFVSVHGRNTSTRAFGIPKRSSVVPAHLREGLRVRDTSALARAAYMTERALAYARTLASEGDKAGRLRRAKLAPQATTAEIGHPA